MEVTDALDGTDELEGVGVATAGVGSSPSLTQIVVVTPIVVVVDSYSVTITTGGPSARGLRWCFWCW